MILAAITSVLMSTTPTFPCGAEVQLKSWKGDYLSRPDTTTSAVTSSASGAGTRWMTECANGKVKLKSWKGDYLHRPNTVQGLTTESNGAGLLEGVHVLRPAQWQWLVRLREFRVQLAVPGPLLRGLRHREVRPRTTSGFGVA